MTLRPLPFLLSLTASLAFAEDKPAQPPRPEAKPFLDSIELKDGDTLVFLGDSITHQCLYTQYVEDYFYTRQPKDRIHFHNAGISGDTGGDAVERFEDDVAPYKPKYVTTLIGMNDGGYREFNPDFFNSFRGNMFGVMDRIAGIGAKAIVMTPTMYDSRSRRLFCEPGEPRDTYYNGVLALYGAWTREQADVRGLGFVDMYSPLNNLTLRERKRDPKWTMIRDSFHPDAPGHCVMACAVINDVVKKSVVSDVSLRLANGKWEPAAENATVSDVAQKDNVLTFTVLENALPWVLPADAADGVRVTNLNALYNKESLAVTGLKSGTYELKIDNTSAGQWTEAQLAAGIELQANPNTPQHQQAKKVAELNTKRNDQFIRPSRTEFQKIKTKRHELHKAEFDKTPDLADRKAALEQCRVEVKAKVAELLKGAAEIEDQIYASNQPKPRRYELIPVTLFTDAGDGEKVLFNGKDLTGWRTPRGTWSAFGAVTLDAQAPATFNATAGEGVLVNNPKGTTSDLLTEAEHGDCELHVEFCVTKGSNSGVYLMGRYEVQVFDSFGKEKPDQHDCGAIYERWSDHGYEGSAPKVNACKPAGEWQSFDITFRAPRFDAYGRKIHNARFMKVMQNGQEVQGSIATTGPTRSATFNDEKATGPLMLQGDHGTVAYRNIRLKPIQLSAE